MPEHPVPRSVLVLGAGLAGLRTVAELRARGFSGEVTVVGTETVPPYDRPPLSKELFARTEPRWLSDDGLGDLTELADRVVLGHRAVAMRAGESWAEVDVEAVETGTGAGAGAATYRADVVVLAVGAHAVAPSSWRGAVTLHRADDADRLRGLLRPGRRLVVVGAGWIGAEVSGLAAAQGCDVTVVEAAPAPLARQVGTAVGRHLVPWYAEAGVDLRCSTPVHDVRPGEVELAGGEVLPADVVLAATGVRPATAWLEGSVPLTPGGAIPVDAAGRVTGAPPSVRAVGDCTDMTVAGLGTVPGGHWDAALTQPAAVVAGLLGGEQPPTPAPYVFSTQFGRHLTLVGRSGDGARVVYRGDPTGPAWTALFVEDRPGSTVRLVAGFTADRPRDVGPLRRLLVGGARPALDVEKAADPAVPLKKALAWRDRA
ncbi:FAD-dependent oxidoreductase [Georgenia halophila]|uniref:FAD-dependent oxidoreductase n=1 Tax=Georgenia halophila TaxID=620889 RepID=A0ABP8KV94_9MICO